jgi:phosphopantothenoylcysteine synthetase/decarboxylase
MNTVMLESVPVREHLARLSARGVHVLPTLGGTLACGEIGEECGGTLPPPCSSLPAPWSAHGSVVTGNP